MGIDQNRQGKIMAYTLDMPQARQDGVNEDMVLKVLAEINARK